MKKHIIYLLMMSVIFTSCTAQGNSVTQPTVQIFTMTPTEANVETSEPYTPKFNIVGYNQEELKCADFLKTTWGSNPDQWGDPIHLPAQSRDKFPAPIFGMKGELYITDLVNQRILVYDEQHLSPIATIALSKKYYSDPETKFPMNPWAIVVTDTQIFVPYGLDRLAILALDGRELRDIQLPYHLKPMAPAQKPILINSEGGLLINGEKIAYFDKGWEEGNWKEVSSGTDFIINPYSWKDYIIGQSGVELNIYSYKVDITNDFLKTPTEIAMGLNLTSWLVGISQDGWIYNEVPTESGYAYTRYGIQNNSRQFGVVTFMNSLKAVQSSISPNGGIYIIVYNPDDESIQPKIIKCTFPD